MTLKEYDEFVNERHKMDIINENDNDVNIYPVTIKMDRMGYIHVWKANSDKNAQADLFFQNEDEVHPVLDDLTKDEREEVENGYTITTDNFLIDYFPENENKVGESAHNVLTESKDIIWPIYKAGKYAHGQYKVGGVIVVNADIEFEGNPLFYVYSEYPTHKKLNETGNLLYNYEFYTDNSNNKYCVVSDLVYLDNMVEVEGLINETDWNMARNVDEFVEGADSDKYAEWLEEPLNEGGVPAGNVEASKTGQYQKQENSKYSEKDLDAFVSGAKFKTLKDGKTQRAVFETEDGHKIVEIKPLDFAKYAARKRIWYVKISDSADGYTSDKITSDGRFDTLSEAKRFVGKEYFKEIRKNVSDEVVFPTEAEKNDLSNPFSDASVKKRKEEQSRELEKALSDKGGEKEKKVGGDL